MTLRAITWLLGAVLTVAPAISAGAARAATCATEGQTVTVSGKVIARFSTSAKDGRRYRYGAIVLDKPICYHDASFGNVQAAKVLSLIPSGDNGTEAAFPWVGRRLTLTGQLSHVVTVDQPPSPSGLLLFEAKPVAGPG